MDGIPLLFTFAVGLFCVSGAFIGMAYGADPEQAMMTISLGFGTTVWSGLAMVFCRMADVLADICEMLDKSE